MERHFSKFAGWKTVPFSADESRPVMAAKRKKYSAVHKDFGYKGSDYRLKRSAETAAHYTLPQLEACLQVLLELDQSLKSQPVAAQTLLETALCRLALAGSGR